MPRTYVRATKPIRTSFPRRDGGLDHLPFLAHHVAHQSRLLSSGTRRAALRPLLPVPVLVSSRLPRFAQPRYLQERPTTAELPRRCIVRINEHGSKDRAKDASRSACDGVPCLRPVPTLMWRRTTSFPSSAMPSDIRCHRRARYPRRKPLVPLTSRSRPPFQRRTAKRVAFQKTGMPLAATTREG